MTDFLEKYRNVRDEKNSVLCIGLDPLPSEVNEEEILHYCLDLVEKTSDYAAAFKPNSQFLLFNLRVRELRELTREIHRAQRPTEHRKSDNKRPIAEKESGRIHEDDE